MMIRNLIFLCMAYFSSSLMAFPCFFTFVNDSCWTDYSVTVTVTDAETGQSILSLNVPKGESWARQAFVCKPNQKIFYTATFNPPIWENTEEDVYRAKHYWMLPSAPKNKEEAWDIPVCFPTAFAAVPFPPKAIGNCQCNLNKIPPIPPIHK